MDAKQNKQSEEDATVSLLQKGDSVAFRSFVQKYQSKAMSMAFRMVKDELVAEEIVQDSFTKLFRTIKSFQGNSSLSTWFYRIVYTTSLNHLQKTRKLPLHETFSEDEVPVYTEPSVFELLASSEIEHAVRRQLNNLPALYAVVIDLFYVKDYSYEEIVRITGMPLGTVKTRLNRGRTMLRDALLKIHPEVVGQFERESEVKGSTLP